MYLKKLEIHGFKSFAKKATFNFEPGITSIVGPNGSGKSNIADCLRWVFGEQSMKLLRGKKAPDVIFAGSDKKARLGGAEAAVYFDNSDHKMPLDYEEVVISRRVYRDGNSDYLLNGNQVRLLDIAELLAKSGFANTSYCVIGQGMIDQLVLGGAQAVKELLEEASGVKPYYIKRERTLRRLERTRTNLEQVQALVREIEPRLRSLRRQTRRLEQRADLEKELREALLIFFGQQFRLLDRQISEVAAKSEVFDRQTEGLNEEIKRFIVEIAAQENDLLKKSESYRKFNTDIHDLQEQKFKLQEELAVIRGKLKVEESMPARESGPDWSRLREKFRAAFVRLQYLFKNFTQDEARRVEELFAEVKDLLESSVKPESPGGKSVSAHGLRAEEQRLLDELNKLLQSIQTLDADLKNYTTAEDETKQQLFVKERLLRNKQETLVKTAQEKNLLAVEHAKLTTRREAKELEAETDLGAQFRVDLEAHPAVAAPPNLQEKILQLRKQLNVIGGVDELIVQEHEETAKRYDYLTTQASDLEKGVADLEIAIGELDEVIKKEFNEAFEKISSKFAEYFRILFNGGRATMMIQRASPPAPEEIGGEEEGVQDQDKEEAAQKQKNRVEITGIDIRATPPGKKLAGIAALSGGERALTSIALLSAILASYPSPFVVLDEVDAALDEANSIRFGKILGTLAHKTQFITITHNRETMRQSHTLYGITMGEDGVSKILSLKLEQAAAYSSEN